MSQRRVSLVKGEYYHVYNRGVDKRPILGDHEDVQRFLQGMREFNTKDAIGSLYENSFREEDNVRIEPLVEIIAYCLNPNHYHFIFSPIIEKGLEKFMQRLGTGYTMYFNKKYKRSGSLFQGVFKSSHIGSNEYLLYVSAYVNLNNRVHQLGGEASKLVNSSWKEYTGRSVEGMCQKDIVLKQFANAKEYEEFALGALKNIIARKEDEKELKTMLID